MTFRSYKKKWRLIAAICSISLLALCDCKNDVESENDLEPSRSSSSSSSKSGKITEQHGDATITWAVSSGGRVKAVVKPDGKKATTEGISGALTVKPFGSTAEPKVVPLEADDGELTADIGKLKADLTQVSYEIGAKGDTLKGVMHLPPGGTSKLLESAKTAEKSGVDMSKKGPHGGLLQVVGDDLVEVVGNTKTGELRVYVLDDDRKPVPVGERKMKVAMYGSPAEMVGLKASAKGDFFFGKLKHKHNPIKVTLWVEHHHVIHTCIVHHHPAKVIHVGHHAPHPAIYVVNNWHVDVHVHGHGHHKHKHYKHKHKHYKHKHRKHKRYRKHGKPRVTISF